MTAHFLRIERWEDLPGAIARMQLAGADHRAVPLQATYRGIVAHVEVQRDTSSRLVKLFMASARRPALVLIGDDDDEPTGPMQWRQAARLIRWARLVIIHAACGRREEYEKAVSQTLAFQRVLLIETDSAHALEWFAMASAAPHRPELWTLLPASGVHPEPMARGKMQ